MSVRQESSLLASNRLKSWNEEEECSGMLWGSAALRTAFHSCTIHTNRDVCEYPPNDYGMVTDEDTSFQCLSEDDEDQCTYHTVSMNGNDENCINQEKVSTELEEIINSTNGTGKFQLKHVEEDYFSYPHNNMTMLEKNQHSSQHTIPDDLTETEAMDCSICDDESTREDEDYQYRSDENGEHQIGYLDEDSESYEESSCHIIPQNINEDEYCDQSLAAESVEKNTSAQSDESFELPPKLCLELIDNEIELVESVNDMVGLGSTNVTYEGKEGGDWEWFSTNIAVARRGEDLVSVSSWEILSLGDDSARTLDAEIDFILQ